MLRSKRRQVFEPFLQLFSLCVPCGLRKRTGLWGCRWWSWIRDARGSSSLSSVGERNILPGRKFFCNSKKCIYTTSFFTLSLRIKKWNKKWWLTHIFFWATFPRSLRSLQFRPKCNFCFPLWTRIYTSKPFLFLTASSKWCPPCRFFLRPPSRTCCFPTELGLFWRPWWWWL